MRRIGLGGSRSVRELAIFLTDGVIRSVGRRRRGHRRRAAPARSSMRAHQGGPRSGTRRGCDISRLRRPRCSLPAWRPLPMQGLNRLALPSPGRPQARQPSPPEMRPGPALQGRHQSRARHRQRRCLWPSVAMSPRMSGRRLPCPNSPWRAPHARETTGLRPPARLLTRRSASAASGRPFSDTRAALSDAFRRDVDRALGCRCGV